MARDLSQETAFNLHDNRSISRATQPSGGIFGHSVEHRLNIRRRASDHA